MSTSFFCPYRSDSSFKHKMQHHWKESHEVNRCLPGGASTNTTDNDLTHTTKEQEKCVLRRLSRRKCHFLIAENIWLREKRSLGKSQFYTWEDDAACKEFFHYLGRKCTKDPIAQPTNLFKTSLKMTRDEKTACGTVNLKTETGNEITAKNLDGGGAEAKEGYLGALEAGFLLWLHLHLQRRQARSSYTDHLQQPPVTLCICVRQPQQRRFRVLCCCSLEWNPTLMGTWAGAISSLIAFYISYLLRTKMYFWLGMASWYPAA